MFLIFLCLVVHGRTCRTATDACGNSKCVTHTIAVVDTQPPRLIGVPSNLELDCKGQVPPMANVTAQDDCACPATVTALESHYPGECPSAFTIVREWTATDCWYVCKTTIT